MLRNDPFYVSADESCGTQAPDMPPARPPAPVLNHAGDVIIVRDMTLLESARRAPPNPADDDTELYFRRNTGT